MEKSLPEKIGDLGLLIAVACALVLNMINVSEISDLKKEIKTISITNFTVIRPIIVTNMISYSLYATNGGSIILETK